MTQVHDFSLSLICLSQAVAAEAATEAKTGPTETQSSNVSSERSASAK